MKFIKTTVRCCKNRQCMPEEDYLLKKGSANIKVIP